jgi:hypothetical protein
MGMQMGMKTTTPMGSHTGSHTGEPKKGTRDMKSILLVTALLMSSASITSAQDRTHEYRMWSAEQMIKRIAEKMVRTHKACDQAEYLVGQRLSEKCIASVIGAYPIVGKIREVAASGDAVRWAALIDAVHQFEADIEGPLNTLERR